MLGTSWFGLLLLLRNPPGGAFLLQQIEMEQGRGQTHSQVHGCHLILFHQVDHVVQETQERLQDLSVLIGQEQNGSLHCLQPLLFGDI